MNEPPFEIRHSWGDPREPEYRNGSRVSFAHYIEGDVHLFFSMYPLKSDGGTSVVLEAPANIRVSLDNDWSKCEIVIRRVVDYLSSLDASTFHRNYVDLVIDTSAVPKWLPTQITLFERSHPFLIDTLPTARTLPFVAVGLTIAYLRERNVLDKNADGTGFTLMAVGALIMGMLCYDIFKRWAFLYRYSPYLFLSRPWTVKDNLQGTFQRYWRRYLVMFCLSLLCIGEGVR